MSYPTTAANTVIPSLNNNQQDHETNTFVIPSSSGTQPSLVQRLREYNVKAEENSDSGPGSLSLPSTMMPSTQSSSMFPLPAIMGWRTPPPPNAATLMMNTTDSVQQLSSFSEETPVSSLPSSTQWKPLEESQTKQSDNGPILSPPAPVLKENRRSGVRKRRSGSRWTEEEDKRLITAYIRNNGRNWTQIAREVGTGKTGDQCNQHWHRVLNPGISKEPWTTEDDKKLKEQVKEMGESSWKKVSEIFPGRTDLQCRHRWLNLKKMASGKRGRRSRNSRSRRANKRIEEKSEEEPINSEFTGQQGDHSFPQPHGFFTQDENGQMFFAMDGLLVNDNYGWQTMPQTYSDSSGTYGHGAQFQGNVQLFFNNQTTGVPGQSSSDAIQQADGLQQSYPVNETSALPMVGSQFPGTDSRFPPMGMFTSMGNSDEFN